MSLRAGTSSDTRTAGPGEKVVIFTCLASNGTNKMRIGYLGAQLADADGVTVNEASAPLESSYELLPGAAAHQTIPFVVKVDFMPVKILIMEKANGQQPVFRIDLKPTDIPG